MKIVLSVRRYACNSSIVEWIFMKWYNRNYYDTLVTLGQKQWKFYKKTCAAQAHPTTYTITYSMEQSPSWQANRFSASQEISAFYGTRRFITAFTRACHLSLSWASSIQSIPLQPTSLKIHLNILPSTPGLPSGLFPTGFPTKTLYTPLPSPIRATCPAHHILLDFITRTILGKEYR